jgi:hypothetical protein
LVRPGSIVSGINVEMAMGDLGDAPTLEPAMAGCSPVGGHDVKPTPSWYVQLRERQSIG